MAGVGEASAIIAIVHLGFSLATALNTYVSEVMEARNDILGLTSDIDSTFAQLRDLGKLIEQNETTKVWSEDGVKLAQKCVTDCQKVTAKLRKLLKKSTASVTSDEVERDEIDVSKLEKALWPIYKPELEVQKQELRSIKQDILIAYASYNAKAGATELDRKRAINDLPRLQRTRALVRKQVRAAKDQRRSRLHSGRRVRHGMGQSSRYHHTPDLSDYYAEGTHAKAGSNNSFEFDDEIIYQNWDDVEADFEDWLEDRESERKRAEEERKKLEDDAVEAWKKQRLREAVARRVQVESDRHKLCKELQAQGMAERQIYTMLDKIHPFMSDPDEPYALIPASAPAPRPDSVAPDESQSSKRRSIWSRASRSGRTTSSPLSSTDGNHDSSVPKLLQDPLAENGIAHLEAFYYQRMIGHESERIRKVGVELPEQWLLETLIRKEEKHRKHPEKVNSIWKEFAKLPNDYRYFITEDLSRPHVSYGDAGESEDRWVLVFVECLHADDAKGFLGRKKRDDIVGIYIVLKRIRKHQPQRVSRPPFDRGSEALEGEEVVIERRERVLKPDEQFRTLTYDDEGGSRSKSRSRRVSSRSFTRDSYIDQHQPHSYGGARRSSRGHSRSRPRPSSRSPSPSYDRRRTVRRSPSPPRPSVELYPKPTFVEYGYDRSRDAEHGDRSDFLAPAGASAGLDPYTYPGAVYPPIPTPMNLPPPGSAPPQHRQPYGPPDPRSGYSGGPPPVIPSTYPSYPHPPPHPRRQYSDDSFSGRRQEVRFESPLRRNKDDSLTSQDSRHDRSRHPRRPHGGFDQTLDKPILPGRPPDPNDANELSDIFEVPEEISLSSDTSTSSDADVEDLVTLQSETDKELGRKMLSEYTSADAPVTEQTAAALASASTQQQKQALEAEAEAEAELEARLVDASDAKRERNGMML